jgi:protein phosphatase
MKLLHDLQGATDVGRVRQANEDSHHCSVDEAGTLLVVCDGMGGHEGGQVASRVAVEALVASLRPGPHADPPRAIFEALGQANEEVLRASYQHQLPGMGTTAVVAWAVGSQCWVGWVGDSRMYHIRHGRIVERTMDHTRVQSLVNQGLLKPEEVADHPEAHVLVQALGATREFLRQEVWVEPLDLQVDDVVLLCSDGLYDMIDDPELAEMVMARSSADAAQGLVDEANARGGHDNVTAVVLHLRDGEAVTRTTMKEISVEPYRNDTDTVPSIPVRRPKP